MAIYSTLFLCAPSELPAAFPGWKLPLATPRTRTAVNPFTREETTVSTREPEWDDFDFDSVELPESEVMLVDGDYETYLENRLNPLVRSLPHRCTKGLTAVELEPLVAAVCGHTDGCLETALYAPPTLGAGLETLPEDFVARIKSADECRLSDCAREWATSMSTPEHTHSVTGSRVADDWSVDDALALVGPIASLANEQVSGQQMYLLTEA